MTRIAVVEDNPDNRLLVHALLEDRYEVVEYETGAEALVGFQTTKPDLILLDISLPEMSGEEVLSRIRQDPELKDISVIALTAHSMPQDREHFLDLGFDEYVAKPITDEEDLFGTIERLLR